MGDWTETDVPAHAFVLERANRTARVSLDHGDRNTQDSPMTHPITLCRYFVKSGREDEFRALLDRHFPTMKTLGLVRDDVPHTIFRGEDNEAGVYFVEVFPWRDQAAMDAAHTTDEVAAIWGPMGECCTKMEFPSVTLL